MPSRLSSTAVRERASAYYTAINASTEKQAKAVEAGVPAARVVRLTGAHYIFLSNESNTLHEIRQHRKRFQRMSVDEQTRFIADETGHGREVSPFETDPREGLAQFLREFGRRTFASAHRRHEKNNRRKFV